MVEHITEEPSIGSIVVDCEDDKWQRGPDGKWYVLVGEVYDWHGLRNTYGPITLVWSPDE